MKRESILTSVLVCFLSSILNAFRALSHLKHSRSARPSSSWPTVTSATSSSSTASGARPVATSSTSTAAARCPRCAWTWTPSPRGRTPGRAHQGSPGLTNVHQCSPGLTSAHQCPPVPTRAHQGDDRDRTISPQSLKCRYDMYCDSVNVAIQD